MAAMPAFRDRGSSHNRDPGDLGPLKGVEAGDLRVISGSISCTNIALCLNKAAESRTQCDAYNRNFGQTMSENLTRGHIHVSILQRHQSDRLLTRLTKLERLKARETRGGGKGGYVTEGTVRQFRTRAVITCLGVQGKNLIRVSSVKY
jgi:hypothetical protein